MPIGNIAGSQNKIDARDTGMYNLQLIEFCVDDASTVVQLMTQALKHLIATHSHTHSSAILSITPGDPGASAMALTLT